MKRALFFIWLRWALWITLFSVITAALLSLAVTFYMYFAKGAIPLDSEVINALVEIGLFWFAIFWSVTLPLSTFFGMKQLFKVCHNGRNLQLFSCVKEPIDDIGYEDLTKVWRKWLFLIIWGVAAQLVFIIALQYIVGNDGELMRWFNIYYMYAFVMTSSFTTLVIMVNRCKLVELKRC